jgi:hypothetical protein
LEDFLVSQLRPLAGDAAPGTSDGSGPKLHDALGRFDRAGRYSKMSPDFFQSTEALPSGKYSETWPASGTMRAGSVSPLPMWAPPTRENGSGSSLIYPTPQARDWKRPSGRSMKGEENDLPNTLASWATPSARDWKDLPGMAVEATNPDGSLRKRDDQLGRQANQFGDPGPTPSLFGEPMAPSDSSPVTPWQTPAGFSGERRRQVGQETREELLLPGEVKAWATPDTAPDAPNRGHRTRAEKAGNPDAVLETMGIGNQARALTGSRAAYNPRFGLWLMGLPVDWLDEPVFRGQRPKRTTPRREEAATECPAVEEASGPATSPTKRPTSRRKRKAG